MNNNVNKLAQLLARQNPQVANNPRAQDLLNVIFNNDSVRGEEIARNLCQTYGVTPEQAVQQARQYFKI